ncbi:MAG TPA: hypothetical protein ENK05_06790 [Gammaproteobacteria bacterium]|nr:hypothetical protein [Gammaproteobacteria bacterium]
MFFKRFLTIWFLAFTLLNSSTWAFSAHDAAALDGGAVQMQDQDHDHPLSGWCHTACNDHCGHAGAHFLGLIPSFRTPDGGVAPRPVTSPQHTPLSRVLAPPFEPPIA